MQKIKLYNICGVLQQKNGYFVPSNKENIFHNKNFNIFTSKFKEVLKLALETFWEQDVKVIVQAVNDFREIRKEKLISNIDFFTSQIKVDNHKPVAMRLSAEFVEDILAVSLGVNSLNFKLNQVTPLEIKILNGFCEFCYKKLNEILIPVKEAKLSEKSEKNINLLFMISSKNEHCSKMMISIPQDRVDLTSLKKTVIFKDEDFLNSRTTVRLKAGSSKITFDELQNLALDDIIVLENSELAKMTMISGKVETKFNIKINPSLIIDINNDDEEDEQGNIQIYDEVVMTKNLWDDIQIEINAEFEKVKMTIGELKQITQGQVVDLGSVFENEISLYVEEKKVAKGELIIVNDRYAVRLNEILNTSASSDVPVAPKENIEQATPATQKPQVKPQVQAKPQPRPVPPQKPAVKPAPAPQAKNEDEEFDYSDFEK